MFKLLLSYIKNKARVRIFGNKLSALGAILNGNIGLREFIEGYLKTTIGLGWITKVEYYVDYIVFKPSRDQQAQEKREFNLKNSVEISNYVQKNYYPLLADLMSNPKINAQEKSVLNKNLIELSNPNGKRALNLSKKGLSDSFDVEELFNKVFKSQISKGDKTGFETEEENPKSVSNQDEDDENEIEKNLDEQLDDLSIRLSFSHNSWITNVEFKPDWLDYIEKQNKAFELDEEQQNSFDNLNDRLDTLDKNPFDANSRADIQGILHVKFDKAKTKGKPDVFITQGSSKKFGIKTYKNDFVPFKLAPSKGKHYLREYALFKGWTNKRRGITNRKQRFTKKKDVALAIREYHQVLQEWKHRKGL